MAASPSVAMSRAILRVSSLYGSTLSDIPDEALKELSIILGAFAHDFKVEVEAREPKGNSNV